MNKHVTIKEMKKYIQEETGDTWKDWAEERDFNYFSVRRLLCGILKGRNGQAFLIRKALENQYQELMKNAKQ